VARHDPKRFARYYLELRRIIEASEPAERVALVNLQLMRLDEPV
jgi:hypothetical protein